MSPQTVEQEEIQSEEEYLFPEHLTDWCWELNTTVAGECLLHFILDKNLGLYGVIFFLVFVCLFL